MAAAIAIRQLRAIGCSVVGPVGRAPSGCCLRVSMPPGAAGGPSVWCEVTWPGPVRLPLADEHAVQAACGIMHVHGRKSGAPVPLGIDYASAVAGVLAAQGALASLIAQLRGLNVRGFRTSVAEAALLAVAQYLAAATAADDWPQPLLPGGPPFESADGVRFEIEVFQAEGWRRFWSALGADESAAGAGWRPFEQRYATATCPLPGELHQAAGRHRFAVVADLATQAGVSILRVNAGPAGRDARAGLMPWRITSLPGAGALTDTGMSNGAGGLLPLDGLAVVESGRRIQGPLAGHILAMLGARVIRVEPPGGDPMRGMPPMDGECSARFRALNRGKEVVEIDLKSPAGRHDVRDLAAAADVFLHNWAPGTAVRLGMDVRQLARANRRLVYAWASGWGDALGPAPPLGTDFMVQAHSGLAALVRGSGEPPAPSLMTLTDVLGGLVCAQGVLVALLARLATGQGQRVDSSLLSAAAMLLDSAASGTRDMRAVPVPVCTDLSALAADTRFEQALCRDGAVYPRPPWRFSS